MSAPSARVANVDDALRLVGPDTRVALTRWCAPEPRVIRWEDFVRDNRDDEGLDWSDMAVVLAAGGCWHDGGGAGPPWSLQVVR